jgi:hypothetical protein
MIDTVVAERGRGDRMQRLQLVAQQSLEADRRPCHAALAPASAWYRWRADA